MSDFKELKAALTLGGSAAEVYIVRHQNELMDLIKAYETKPQVAVVGPDVAALKTQIKEHLNTITDKSAWVARLQAEGKSKDTIIAKLEAELKRIFSDCESEGPAIKTSEEPKAQQPQGEVKNV